MRKLLFIFFGAFLLIAYSCQKEEISPRAYNSIESNSDSDNDLPPSSALGNGKQNGKTSGTSDPTDPKDPITDPDRDEDDNKKIKAKPQ